MDGKELDQSDFDCVQLGESCLRMLRPQSQVAFSRLAWGQLLQEYHMMNNLFP